MEEFTQERPLFRIRKTCLLVHIDGVDPLTFQPHAMRPSKKQPGNKNWKLGDASASSAGPITTPHAA